MLDVHIYLRAGGMKIFDNSTKVRIYNTSNFNSSGCAEKVVLESSRSRCREVRSTAITRAYKSNQTILSKADRSLLCSLEQYIAFRVLQRAWETDRRVGDEEEKQVARGLEDEEQ